MQIYSGGMENQRSWDGHNDIKGNHSQFAGETDTPIAGLLTDLEQRGLSDQVQVVVWGEFGRTPRINAKGGRDHWERTQSILMAGGNVQGGCTLGTTDKQGGVPIERPVHVQEVFATMYHALGINPRIATIRDTGGRPQYLVDPDIEPIRELV